MNVDELVRDALREQAAAQAPTAAGLADRVLAVRRRRRTRRLVAAAAATVAVVAVTVAVPLLDSGKEDVRPAHVVERTGIDAQPDQSPPRDLISADGTTLAAYYVPRTVEQSAGKAASVRTYWLLDQRTGRYVKAPQWSYVAVAPGMKTAAVLEQQLPAPRIGLLDLATGKVERWIPVDHGVAGLSFSRDGRKLVATTYGENPDLRVKMEGSEGYDAPQQSTRTGFYVLDVASGKGSWSEVGLDGDPNDPMGGGFINSRQDFALSDDGRHVWCGNPMGDIGKQFYDLTGREVAVPAKDKHLQWYVDAGKSPSGRLVAGDFAGEKWKTSSWVLDARTGRRTEVRGQQLLAWVGEKSLVAWDITPGSNEFHNRLVLVTIGSDKVVPLSGFRKGNDGAAGRWEPVFAQP
ncbi:WD40 repeat domain-containing protein [Streptomyces sp. HUCO-GS316]|uniref:WD40 repeat domain-containing protein n=1 Tax=Streptomyces sp. HUCO-GS316 TaxID=2692198 RepID=UPI00136CCB0B|nr:WD40 repeat domain-containing protein [Streptomyces sp. HUCO-GS316]